MSAQPKNFDTEKVYGKWVLEAFRDVLNGKSVNITYGGDSRDLSDFLKDPNHPGGGFRDGIFPGPVKKVSMSVEDDCKTTLSYHDNYRLKYELLKRHWESKNYSTEEVENSLHVFDRGGNLVAQYGYRRIKITREGLDKFIRDMGESDFVYLKPSPSKDPES
tara:strand:+ start:867 stop:1352 length:486 start_codon:yes stop_codon:yes gene_type:complete